MDFPRNTSIKIEKDDFDRDCNDNIRELLFDVEIKVEKELETNEDEDWCVSNFENCGDLLEPLFFKQINVPEGPQCELCYEHFEDRLAILKHNLTHLRVTISNPTLFQCDCCASYFTHKPLLIQHLSTHNQNISRAKTFSCETSITKMDSDYKINLSDWNELITYKPNIAIKTNNSNQYSKIKIKPRDGMTNLLNYKPKSSKIIDHKINLNEWNQQITKTDYSNQIRKTKIKPRDGMTNLLNYKPKSCKSIFYKCDINLNETKNYTKNKTKKTHQCMKCNKTFTYRNWHAHMREVHGDGGYFCGMCNIEFKCETYLKRHMIKKHTKNSENVIKICRGEEKIKVKCDECDTILQCLNALATHKRNVHSKDRHVCHICNSELKCKSYLLTHMRRVHYTDGQSHMCSCGKSFRSHRYLTIHKRNAHHT